MSTSGQLTTDHGQLTTTSSPPRRPSLRKLRRNILRNLALALDTAAARFRDDSFPTSNDRCTALALTRLLPSLLPHFPKKTQRRFNYPLPLIPPCNICGQGPGAHWPQDCPSSNKESTTTALQ